MPDRPGPASGEPSPTALAIPTLASSELPEDRPRPAAEAAPERPALLGLDRDRLAALLGELADRPFRVDQVWRAVNRRGVASFSEMTDLPKALRAELARRFRIGLPEVASRRRSEDETTKYLLRLADGATIEAVDIPEHAHGRVRHTLCVSSQAGCALGCTFCVTGYWGAGRNLEPGEIVGQYLVVRRDWEREGRVPPRVNLVFMGMGEPLSNLEGLAGALGILSGEIPWRRITVSTAGVVPGIDAMALWPERPRLAISLHAPDDERRDVLMPLNRTWPLDELLAAVRRYPRRRGERVTFEYLLIDGFNDSPADADLLARLLASRLDRGAAKVNLIPVNPDPVLGEAMVPPPPEVVDAFRRRLRERGLVATVRRPRGDDVSAACGQLRAFGRDPRGVAARRCGRQDP